MWANNESLAKAHQKNKNFSPPYCANPACEWHFPDKVDSDRPFNRYGIKIIQRYPYFSQRFQCRRCRRTFSSSFFTLEYRDKRANSYEQIHDFLIGGTSGREIARRLKINEDTVRRRKKKLARWALLRWARDTSGLKLRESVAYDGLENFSFSQFDPNNVNHAVGRSSYFIYDFNLAPMNRKGRMSPGQKLKDKQLCEVHGRYSGHAIEHKTKKIFQRLLSCAEGPLTIHTDNHYAYRRALSGMPERDRIIQNITPAKAARNYRNRLFAINHTDMLTRHLLTAYKRETIAFAKHTVSMLESFVIFAAHKNYLRPIFYKKHLRDKTIHVESPAMRLGLRKKIQKFREFYRTRVSFHHVRLNDDWRELFDSTDHECRRTIRAYAGI